MSGYYKLRLHPEYALFVLLGKLMGAEGYINASNNMHTIILKRTGHTIQMSPQWIRETV